jgi:hypothetical protein
LSAIKAQEDQSGPLVAHDEPSEVLKPCVGPLHDPTPHVAPQWAAAALGATVLLGWTFGIAGLKSILPATHETNPLCAIVLILLAAATALTRNPKLLARRRFAADVLSAAAVAIDSTAVEFPGLSGN